MRRARRLVSGTAEALAAGRRIVAAAVLFGAVGAGAWLPGLAGAQGAGVVPGSLTRDSVEAAVLLAVLRGAVGAPQFSISGTSALLGRCAASGTLSGCVGDSAYINPGMPLDDVARDALRAAADDFHTRNTALSALPTAVLEQLRAEYPLPPDATPADSCRQPRWVRVTRVGLDPGLRFAYAGYWVRAGVPPYMSCGFSYSGVVLLQRQEDGTWAVIGRSGLRVA